MFYHAEEVREEVELSAHLIGTKAGTFGQYTNIPCVIVHKCISQSTHTTQKYKKSHWQKGLNAFRKSE